MSYANIETIKKHFPAGAISAGWERDYPLVWAGTGWYDLPGFKISDGTIIIKAVKDIAPFTETIVSGTAAMLLSNSHLVPDSVTVASDSSLGTVFIENIDYYIDYAHGRINRLADGRIPDNTGITVWYYCYSLYTEGTDYQVDYAVGRIRRLASGDISDGQSVCIDYERSLNPWTDDMLGEIVHEVNAIIEKEVDPQGLFGADLTLQTAATFLAVSLAGRMAVINYLGRGQLSAPNVSGWLAVAESYRRDYETLIKYFKAGAMRISHPTHS